MSPRAEFFLGIIAVATLSTAIIQIGVLVAAGLLVRRIQRLIDRIDVELKPIFESVQSIGRDAARVTSLAAGQVERLDRAMTGLVNRMERALSALQGFIEGPLSESAAWFAGLKALLSLIRDVREKRASRRGDEEDALFI